MKKKYEYLRFIKSFIEFYDAAHNVAAYFIKYLYGHRPESTISDIVFFDSYFKFNLTNSHTFESVCFTLPCEWLFLDLAALKTAINAYTNEQLEEMGV